MKCSGNLKEANVYYSAAGNYLKKAINVPYILSASFLVNPKYHVKSPECW